MPDRRLEKIEREARYEAARGVLLAHLSEGRRDDGWFRAPGVTGRLRGRDVEIRFPGGPAATRVRLLLRIRTGGGFAAAPRHRLLRWAGMGYLAVSGQAPPSAVQHAVERLMRDHDAWRVAAGKGTVRAELRWDAAAPDPPRLLHALERLDRVALALEEIELPPVESGGRLSCPYCRAAIGDLDAVARCERCATPYHPTCFEENGGCAVYGCLNRSARTASGRLPPQAAPAPARKGGLERPKERG
jgi:hypothetical protein